MVPSVGTGSWVPGVPVAADGPGAACRPGPANCAPLAAAVPASAGPVAAPGPAVAGRRWKTKVPSGARGSEPAAWSVGSIVAVPSVCGVSPPGGRTASAGSAARGRRGSAPWGAPQDTRRSCSPPKPDCRERSAPQAVAGSGLLPCCASAGVTRRGSAAGPGSSSKKCGPVSSVGAGAGAGTGATGRVPGGGASGTPSDGAGRLVPGTQAAPFQYRTYPGMEGSG